MKKYIVLSVLSAIFLSACTLSDFVVSRNEVHNALVYKIEELIKAEQKYWDTYIALEEGDDGTELAQVHGEFVAAFNDLDTYFEETTFHSTQQAFKDFYYKKYQSLGEDYVEQTSDFVNDVKEKGYSFDSFYGELDVLDKLSADFLEETDSFTGLVNVQADTKVTAE